MGLAKENLKAVKQLRHGLESDCPQGRESSACRQKWRNYKRELKRIQMNLRRVTYIKKSAAVRQSIVDKLKEITDVFSDKEASVVESLMQSASNFELYGEFVGEKSMGGMQNAVRELAAMSERLRDLETFQSGIELHVADMGQMIDARLESFMKDKGMDSVSSREEMLLDYDNQEDAISRMIKNLEN